MVSRDVPANVVVAGNPATIVKELDADEGFVTRADYYADPEGLERFIDQVEKDILGANGFFNWLRALLWPRNTD